jgi:thiamine-phosphate pyrophosphorylase
VRPSIEEALKLYLVTDPVLHGGRGVVPTCREALKAGVRFLQLRDKDASTRELYDTARELKSLCGEYSAWFVMNDRIDVALAACAHGVHLGQSDLPAGAARKIMGPEAVIGVSARTVMEAEAASAAGADYIAANLVFSTSTKLGLGKPLGLDMVRVLSDASSLPLIAIGGIKPENTASVMEAGCSGVAVVTAIMNAESPAVEVKRFLQVLNP